MTGQHPLPPAFPPGGFTRCLTPPVGADLTGREAEGWGQGGTGKMSPFGQLDVYCKSATHTLSPATTTTTTTQDQGHSHCCRPRHPPLHSFLLRLANLTLVH